MNEFQKKGAQPAQPIRYAVLWTNSFYNGIVTQRNPLRGNAPHIEEEYYGSRNDTLIDGKNVELSTKLTLIRRPGHSVYNSQTFPAINRFYENKTIQYSSSQTIPSENIQVVADTASAIYDATGPSTKNLLFTKSAGAGSSYFQSVGNSMYFTDGPDQKKLITPEYKWSSDTSYSAGSLIGETISGSNYLYMALGGITLSIIGSASDGTKFTFWCDLDSIPDNFANLDGVNVTFSGLIAASALNGLTKAVTVVSTTFGEFQVTYAAASYSSTSDTGSATTGNGTSGSSTPSFSTSQFSVTQDSGQQWKCYGDPIQNWGLKDPTSSITITPGSGRFWFKNLSVSANYAILDSNQDVQIAKASGKTGLSYPNWVQQPATASFAVVSATQNSNLASSRPFYQTADPDTTPPTSGFVFQNTSGVAMMVSFSADGGNGGFRGRVYCDGNPLPTTSITELSRVNAGSAPPNYYPGSACFLVPPKYYYGVSVTSGGDSPSTARVWTEWELNGASSSGSSSTGSGSAGSSVQTIDNTVVWNNYGPLGSWQASTPFDGPWDSVAPIGVITDSNGNWQYVSAGGGSSSGASEPTWATAVGATTTDGGLTWTCLGPGSIISTQTLNWGFSTHGVDGSVSTSSAAATVYGPIVGPSVTTYSETTILTLSGTFASDSQIDQLWVWRSTQGGSSASLFLEDQIPADSGSLSYNELGIPDTSLNNQLAAPIAYANEPPPTGMTALSYHLGRIWGAVGNYVYYSDGPDVSSGNGNTAWNPINFFEFPSTVTRTHPTTNGLIVLTISDIYVISGLGTTNSSFYSTPFLYGVGLSSYDAFDVNGAVLFLYTSDNQVLTLDPSSGLSEVGFPIGDQFGLGNGTDTFSPTTAHLTWNFSGSQEKALYVSDFSGNWWRMLPTPSPESGTTWCPLATIAGGFSAVQSVETSPGVHNLLVGPKTSGPILYRDLSVYTDNGTAYDAYGIMGSLVLAQPGQLAVVECMTTDSSKVGSPISLAVQLDEIAPLTSGYFEDLTLYTPDPPQLSPSNSVYAQRFYLSQTLKPALCRHLQIQVKFGTDSVRNELLSLSIFGGFSQEK